MPETGTSGSMSGDGKRGVGHRPQVTAPILNSTSNVVCCETAFSPELGGGLNRSTQHFILEGKDGVWDGTEIS